MINLTFNLKFNTNVQPTIETIISYIYKAKNIKIPDMILKHFNVDASFLDITNNEHYKSF
jgi:hypothetical protein